MNKEYVPEGRELLGECFYRGIDYPETLTNQNVEDTSANNPFWRCRSCDDDDRVRLSGIYWCSECAQAVLELRETAHVHYDCLTEERLDLGHDLANQIGDEDEIGARLEEIDGMMGAIEYWSFREAA